MTYISPDGVVSQTPSLKRRAIGLIHTLYNAALMFFWTLVRPGSNRPRGHYRVDYRPDFRGPRTPPRFGTLNTGSSVSAPGPVGGCGGCGCG